MASPFFEAPTQEVGYRSVCRLETNPVFETLLALRSRDNTTEFVVLKRICTRYRQSAALVKRVLEEARHTVHLAHSHIVRIHDVVLSGMSIVTEYLAGDPLPTMLKRGAPIPALCAILHGAASALAYAHSGRARGAPICHQALSPASVIITDAGEVKLDDFRVMRAAAAHASRSELAQSVSRYLAPEEALDRAGNAPGDLYALGAILHEGLTGVAFDRQRHAHPGVASRDVPLELDRLTAQLLDPCPERRPDAAETMARLEAMPRATPAELADWLATASPRRPHRLAMEQQVIEYARDKGLGEVSPRSRAGAARARADAASAADGAPALAPAAPPTSASSAPAPMASPAAAASAAVPPRLVAAASEAAGGYAFDAEPGPAPAPLAAPGPAPYPQARAEDLPFTLQLTVPPARRPPTSRAPMRSEPPAPTLCLPRVELPPRLRWVSAVTALVGIAAGVAVLSPVLAARHARRARAAAQLERRAEHRAAPQLSARVVSAGEMQRISGAAPRSSLVASDADAPTVSGRAARVQLCVDRDGQVSGVSADVSSDISAALLQALRTEVASWRYEPYLADGAAVPVCFVDAVVIDSLLRGPLVGGASRLSPRR